MLCSTASNKMQDVKMVQIPGVDTKETLIPINIKQVSQWQFLIKPIFDDLASQTLLWKCLPGKTQNNNECLSIFVWDR